MAVRMHKVLARDRGLVFECVTYVKFVVWVFSLYLNRGQNPHWQV